LPISEASYVVIRIWWRRRW